MINLPMLVAAFFFVHELSATSLGVLALPQETIEHTNSASCHCLVLLHYFHLQILGLYLKMGYVPPWKIDQHSSVYSFLPAG
jgi:hypothetical protein